MAHKNLGVIQIKINSTITLEDIFNQDTTTEITNQLTESEKEELIKGLKSSKIISIEIPNIVDSSNNGAFAISLSLSASANDYYYLLINFYSPDTDNHGIMVLNYYETNNSFVLIS